MNNLPKHHGAGPPEVRGPMQLYRLHRLKAGPAASNCDIRVSMNSWSTVEWFLYLAAMSCKVDLGGDWGGRPPKTYESKFIHHDIAEVAKQHLRF